MLHLSANGSDHPSHWRRTVDPGGWPVAADRAYTDVAVVGAGITGLTTAFLLKQTGYRVMILEADKVGSGSTGGSNGRLSALEAPAFATRERERGPEGARIFAAAMGWTMDQVAETVESLDIPCGFTRRPALT